ncbi:hypothetical protein [Halovulum sp. GXIMD14793]
MTTIAKITIEEEGEFLHGVMDISAMDEETAEAIARELEDMARDLREGYLPVAVH